MSANPHTNGKLLRKSLEMPDLDAHAIAVKEPGAVKAEATRVMDSFLREVIQANVEVRNSCVVGPDETASNRLQDLFEVT